MIDAVLGHQLLRAGRQRLRLVRELRGLRLRQQRADLAEDPLVRVAARRPRPGAGRARQRAQPFQHGHVLQQVQQLDGDPQRFPAPGGQELGVAPHHISAPSADTCAAQRSSTIATA